MKWYRLLRSIWQNTQQSAQRQESKSLDIPEGNLVLLWDHPERCNKIQDKYKESEFVIFHRHEEPNVYDIKPINGKGPVCTVNQHQLQDLKRIQEYKGSSDPYASHQGLPIPFYNPKVRQNKSPLTSHSYATHWKGEPPTLSLSTTASLGSEELRKAKSQSIAFCSEGLGKPFWIWWSNERYSTWGVHVRPILWATFETWQHTSFSTIYSFLSPYLL